MTLLSLRIFCFCSAKLSVGQKYFSHFYSFFHFLEKKPLTVCNKCPLAHIAIILHTLHWISIVAIKHQCNGLFPMNTKTCLTHELHKKVLFRKVGPWPKVLLQSFIRNLRLFAQCALLHIFHIYIAHFTYILHAVH